MFHGLLDRVQAGVFLHFLSYRSFSVHLPWSEYIVAAQTAAQNRVLCPFSFRFVFPACLPPPVHGRGRVYNVTAVGVTRYPLPCIPFEQALLVAHLYRLAMNRRTVVCYPPQAVR